MRRVSNILRAADPGGDRRQTAMRGLIASALGLGGALLTLELLGLPSRSAGHAVALGFVGAIALPPVLPRGHLRRVTAGALIGGGVVALTGDVRPLLLVSFVVLAVAASAMVRFGPPGRAVGFHAVLGAVLSGRLGLGVSDLGAMGIAIAFGGVGLWLAACVALPDRPVRQVRRLVGGLHALLALLVADAGDLVAEGPGRRRQLRVRRRLVACQETALSIDELLGRDADDLRRAVLQVEALADHFAYTVLTVAGDLAPVERARLAAAIVGRHADGGGDGDDDPLVPEWESDTRVERVLHRLRTAARLVVAPAGLPARVAPAWGVGPRMPTRAVTTQTLTAVAGSLALGILVAPNEWYWAVLAAYIVVTTTTSRGAGFRKGVDRLIGTAVGVAVGLGLAVLLSGRTSLLLAVVVLLLAAAAWIFRANYRITMVGITVALALLYELTGVLTTRLLVLRVLETGVGVVVAAAVVAVVLPSRTRSTIDRQVRELLLGLRVLLQTLADHGHVGDDDVRSVDRVVSQLRVDTAPLLTTAPTAVGDAVRAARLLATAVRVRAAALATITATSPASSEHLPALQVLGERIDDIVAHLDGQPGRSATPRGDLPATTDPLGRALVAIDDRLVGYAGARGLHLRDRPGALAAGSTDRRA